MNNQIFNQDCYEFMTNIKDKSIDLIVTDPPYELKTSGGCGGMLKSRQKYESEAYKKLTNGFDVDKTLETFQRILKKFNLYIFCSNAQISKIMQWGESKGYSTTLLVWHKYNAIPFCNNTWKPDIEFIIHMKEAGAYCKGGSTIKSKVTTLLLVQSEFNHPTEKPIKLIEKFIRIGSKEGDTVFDPFLGAGTTAVAAKSLNRNFTGCEIEKGYFDTAKKRLENTQGVLL
ncbi:MAG: site-specific DNA-methyltransferase [Campylobacteraceae bacterium]|nr:site-specific DNA-methyltransferase [Campylobacteraceae bacterium]